MVRVESLAEFVDLASTLGYAETARRLLLSESSLSRHIRSLEDDLGAVLFERTSRRVRLSEAGRAFLPHAEAALAAFSAGEVALRSVATAAGASVTIGSNYFVGDTITGFLGAHPGASVQQVGQGETNESLLARLRSGECDLVVLTDDAGLEVGAGSSVIARDTFVAALPEGHPLARRPSVDAALLSGERFVSFRPGSTGDRWIREIGRRAGFEPQVILTSDVGSSLARSVADGLGVTFLLKGTIGKMPTSGVVFVDLVPPVDVIARLCWLVDRPLTPAAQSFRSFAAAASA